LFDDNVKIYMFFLPIVFLFPVQKVKNMDLAPCLQ